MTRWHGTQDPTEVVDVIELTPDEPAGHEVRVWFPDEDGADWPPMVALEPGELSFPFSPAAARALAAALLAAADRAEALPTE